MASRSETHVDWTVAQRYTFTLPSPSQSVVVAVNGENTGGPAGVIVALELDVAITSSACSASFVYVSDDSWKYNLGVPAGFQNPNFPDGSWSNVVVEGIYGVAPWGKIPTVNA